MNGYRSSLAALATAAALAGCVVGAPPGFSRGDMWSVPLVGPLENGPLVVPVRVNGAGPYLFMVDPDAPVSSIDRALAGELGLFTTQAGEVIAENDTKQVVFEAEVRELGVGDLTVSGKKLRLHEPGTFWFGGRLVRGLLGRDVIADSLVVGFDRDWGMMHLATQGNLTPQAGAVAVGAWVHSEPLVGQVVGRYIVPVTLNERHELELYVDLGAPFTMLWPDRIAAAKLPTLRVRTTLHDDLGMAREIETGAMAAKLALGDETVAGLMVLPFGDKRIRTTTYDGALGQNFLSQFNLTINWHAKTLWLKRRTATAFEMASGRMRRWGPTFDRCATPACVTGEVRGRPPATPAEPAASAGLGTQAAPAGAATAALAAAEPAAPAVGAEPAAATEPPPGGAATPASTRGADARTDDPAEAQSLVFRREPWTKDLSYEVAVEAIDAAGNPAGLPLLRVSFPVGATEVVADAGAAPYLGAAGFRAVDLSPFPRPCEPGAAGMRCVWPIAPPR